MLTALLALLLSLLGSFDPGSKTQTPDGGAIITIGETKIGPPKN